MRTLLAGVSAAIVLAMGMAATAPAQEQIIKPGRPAPIAVPQPGQVVVPPPGKIVIPPSDSPIDLTPPPSLEGAPKPQYFVAPGIEGVYAQLRKPSRTKDVPLKPYEPYGSIATPADPSKFNVRQVVVKFVEGSGVRLREGALVVSAEPAATESAARLPRAGLEPGMVQADLATFNEEIRSFRGFAGRAAPGVDELDLLRLRQAAERSTRLEQPDLNLFYFVHLPQMQPEEAQRALQTLAKHRIIETAYFQPIPHNAVDKPPTTTISVTNSQGYVTAAPAGIDAAFARNFAGGRGENVRVADIEFGWNTNHEDLPPMAFGIGVNFGDQHGTAVLGEIAAEENSFGATGIAPKALVGWSATTNLNPLQPIYFYSVGMALLMTGNVLRAGDIALIEQHFPTGATPPCTCLDAMGRCANTQLGFVAVETIPFEHAAISVMTGAGVVVVEAAGNGEMLVTPASTRDSGAIVVGASNTNLMPACFTNFGPRVNVHAWGGSVGSTGYGGTSTTANPALRANGTDPDQWYTRSFGGTSSASPIVVGAAALIQGIRRAGNIGPLSPLAMRSLLATTGTPQAPGATRNIGPLPNLRTAIASFIADAARFVDQTAAPGGAIAPGTTFTIMERFTNSGGVSWFGGHSLAVAPGPTGAAPFGTQSFPLGTAAAPVNPGQTIAQTFSITAPAQPGSYGLVFVLRNPQGQVLAVSPNQQITVTSTTPGPFDATTLTLLSAPGPFKVGLPGIVIVRALNTGTTTWTAAGYGLRMQGSARLSMPQSFQAVGLTIPPGQSRDFVVSVQCQGQGIASFSTQMGGPSGAFGATVGQNVNCQP